MTQNTLVDPSQPMELEDGTPVVVNKAASKFGNYHDAAHTLIAITVNPKNRIGGSNYVFRTDGTHYYRSESRRLRNVVVAPLVDWAKPLQTSDGKAVRYLDRTVNGMVVVEVDYSSVMWSGANKATELRYADGRKSNIKGITSGDDVINKVVETKTYQNVYSNGTIGATRHATQDAAKDRSKYGLTRIGILMIRSVNGKVVETYLTNTQPFTRSRANPSGKVGF